MEQRIINGPRRESLIFGRESSIQAFGITPPFFSLLSQNNQWNLPPSTIIDKINHNNRFADYTIRATTIVNQKLSPLRLYGHLSVIIAICESQHFHAILATLAV